MKDWKSIDIPYTMKDLPKDKDGYPIPFTLIRDKYGIPDFTQHDEILLLKCTTHRICAVCGRALESDIWLLAGAKIALEPGGGYVDPPMHQECGRYSLQVCPYLALPSFLKHSRNEIQKSNSSVRVLSGKPTVFAFVKTADYRSVVASNGTIIIIPRRPFLDIEYWRAGSRISWDQAKHFL